jgi:hypothetical protein
MHRAVAAAHPSCNTDGRHAGQSQQQPWPSRGEHVIPRGVNHCGAKNLLARRHTGRTCLLDVEQAGGTTDSEETNTSKIRSGSSGNAGRTKQSSTHSLSKRVILCQRSSTEGRTGGQIGILGQQCLAKLQRDHSGNWQSLGSLPLPTLRSVTGNRGTRPLGQPPAVGNRRLGSRRTMFARHLQHHRRAAIANQHIIAATGFGLTRSTNTHPPDNKQQPQPARLQELANGDRVEHVRVRSSKVRWVLPDSCECWKSTHTDS